MLKRPPTLAQTIVLLALSRGDQPPSSRDRGSFLRNMQPNLRRALLGRGWIAPPRPFTITAEGRDALATSRWIEKAQKALDVPALKPARSGMPASVHRVRR